MSRLFRAVPITTVEQIVQAADRHSVPSALLGSICTRESRMGLDPRAMGRTCGVWLPVMRAICARRGSVCNGDLLHDQAETAAVIVRDGIGRCRGNWNRVATYFFSGRCVSSRVPTHARSTPLSYGQATAAFAVVLDRNSRRPVPAF